MFQLHLIIVAALTLVFAIPTVIVWFFAARQAASPKYNNGGLAFTAIIGGILSGMFLLALLTMLAPFNSKYWMITPESGTVTSVQTQTVLTSSEATQLTPRFVVTIDDDLEVIMDDPRIRNVEVGDSINVNCTYEYIYAGTDKRNCILN
jgi:hypothetical protein